MKSNNCFLHSANKRPSSVPPLIGKQQRKSSRLKSVPQDQLFVFKNAFIPTARKKSEKRCYSLAKSHYRTSYPENPVLYDSSTNTHSFQSISPDSAVSLATPKPRKFSPELSLLGMSDEEIIDYNCSQNRFNFYNQLHGNLSGDDCFPRPATVNPLMNYSISQHESSSLFNQNFNEIAFASLTPPLSSVPTPQCMFSSQSFDSILANQIKPTQSLTPPYELIDQLNSEYEREMRNNDNSLLMLERSFGN